MRTTISIEDALLRKAKKIAHERRSSLREVIEDALRAFVSAGLKNRSGTQRAFKTFKGSGVQPRVDLTSSAALLDTMESR